MPLLCKVILFLLCLCGQAQAAFIMAGPAGGCTTPAAGDELNEGFLGSGYENSWTETIGATGVLNEDATLSGTPPDGAQCTEGLLASVSTSGGYTHTRWSRGSALPRSAAVDIYGYLRVNSATLPAQYDNIGILNWDNNTTPSDSGASGFLRLSNESGADLRISMGATTTSTKVVLSTGTWYAVKIHLDGTAASSYFRIDAGTACDADGECTFTRYDTADGQHLFLGVVNGLDADEAVAVEWRRVWIDTP